MSNTYLWLPGEAGEPDTHAAFRASFDLDHAAQVAFHLLAASWFAAWLDGELFAEGPARFAPSYPEYQTFQANLPAGRHVLAVHVHGLGVATRMLGNIPPFLWLRGEADGRPLAIDLKAQKLPGYLPQFRRLNPQMAWVEWLDTRAEPDWRAPSFDDSGWQAPVAVERDLGPIRPLQTANTRLDHRGLAPIAQGLLAETYGYERDDPSARFYLRDLNPTDLPPQGVWRRYDLGRVRLGRPDFTVECPEGSVVEFAYAEYLRGGRVAPWVTLAGPSCNLDHFVARGGPQEFFPLHPKGGRFLEVHVLAPPSSVEFLREEFLERGYFGEPEGSYRSEDDLLNRIWSAGVETQRACAEDSLTDNPTRERGQWAGDIVSVGMEVAASAFSDMRLLRRGLVQCAQCARDDGLVAGLCPGQPAYLSTYAAQWVSACLRHWEITGDRDLLRELLSAAKRNLEAFAAHWTPDGLDDDLGWGFVDWGYVRNAGPSDMAVNLHLLGALRNMVLWCDALGDRDNAGRAKAFAGQVEAVVASYYRDCLEADDAWPRIGFHRAVLGARLGLLPGDRQEQALDAIQAHILSCFPNDPAAPRLSDPAVRESRLITPYFLHFALPALFENGRADFALDQIRTCWGWALSEGRTTCLEAFDTRWSHCHQWSACPTWLLSRYVLGLYPRRDVAEDRFVFDPRPGSLGSAKGRSPIAGEGREVVVAWRREGEALHVHLDSPRPLTVLLRSLGTEIRVEGVWEGLVPAPAR